MTSKWLIERGQPKGEPRAIWLENLLEKWTTDANMAMQFDTRESAEAFLLASKINARAVEHGWA